MRILATFFISVLFCSSFAFGQKKDSANQVIMSQLKRLEKLMKKSDTLNSVGKVVLHSANPTAYIVDDAQRREPSYKKKTDSIRYELENAVKSGVLQEFARQLHSISLKVVSVEISIDEGIIENIRVTTDAGMFFASGIPLYNRYRGDRFELLWDLDKRRFIIYSDIIWYLPVLGQDFIPDNDSFILDGVKQTEYTLKINSTLNSNIDLRIYSDMLAFFNQKSNGLVQTDVTSRIINKRSQIKRSMFLGQYFEPGLRYSKFDSKDAFVQLSDSTAIGKNSVTTNPAERLRLNQLSTLSLTFKMNYLKIKTLSNYTEFNLGFSYNFVNVRSANKNAPSKLANMWGVFYEFKSEVLKFNNFGTQISLMLMFQFLSNTEVQFSDPTVGSYAVPEVVMYYNPNQNKSNRIFVRFRSFADMNNSLSYPIFQFGYSSSLNLGNLGKSK